MSVFVLLLPMVASIYLGMCYVERFPSARAIRNETANAINAALHKEAIYLFPLFAGMVGLITVLAGLVYSLIMKEELRSSTIIAFVIHAAMFFYYGVHLRRLPLTTPSPSIRHQLVWPIILSIGFSLYYGMNFSSLRFSHLPVVPIYAIAAFFAVTTYFRFSDQLLAITGGIAIVVTGAAGYAISLNLLPFDAELGQYLLTANFCIIVSAYLAVFEAWKVTSELADLETDTTGRITVTTYVSKAHRYSGAALLALLIVICALPLFFIFSDYGTVFLVLFGAHAVVSFLAWTYFGHGTRLVEYNWPTHKVVAGVAFLAVLILCSFPGVDQKPITRTMDDFVGWIGFLVLSLVALIPAISLAYTIYRRKGTIREEFVRYRINFVRLLPLLSLVGCVLLLTFGRGLESNPERYLKRDLAFVFYAFCIALSLVAEVGYNAFKPERLVTSATMKHVLAFLVLIRVVTTSLITLCVVLPSLYVGNGFASSLISASPFFLAGAGGFALNDFFDVNRDRINRPYRAIPSGMLSARLVLTFGWVLILGAAVAALVWSQNTFQLALYAICIFGVTVYNVFVRYLTLSKTFLTASVSALPVLFSVVSFGYGPVYLFLPAATALFVLGREWLMDIKDLNGDAIGGIVTVPMKIGANATFKISFFFQTVAVLMILPVVLRANSIRGFVLFTCTILVLVLCFYLWPNHRAQLQQRVIHLLWLPMLFGLLLFVV